MTNSQMEVRRTLKWETLGGLAQEAKAEIQGLSLKFGAPDGDLGSRAEPVRSAQAGGGDSGWGPEERSGVGSCHLTNKRR